MKKKYLLPIVVGVVVFGGVTAFAASLTVNSSSLGAGNATVASCTDNAKVTYATTGSTVTTATVKTFDALGAPTTSCNGFSADVTLTSTSGTVTLGEVTGPITNATTVFTLPAGIDAHDVTGVSVTITG
jgi:hypothetical protein